MWQARKDMLAVVPARMITHIRRYQVEDRLSQHETSLSTWVRDDRMRGILKAWKYLSSYLRSFGKERKCELFGDTLEAAVQAEANGDRQSLYTAIRKLAPKVPRIKTHVRGWQGQLLSQEEENLEFKTYCTGLFAPDTCQDPEATHMDGSSDPLTEAELAKALQGLAAKKAVPPHAASMQLWKIGADVVIPALANICQQF